MTRTRHNEQKDCTLPQHWRIHSHRIRKSLIAGEDATVGQPKFSPASERQVTRKFPLTFELHVRDLVRLVSGRFHAVADDEVNIGKLLVVVVATGSVPRLVVHGHADSLGLEPPPVAPPRRSASRRFLRRPGLATMRGCKRTER